ncbi:phage tail tube protein [Acetobacter oeni]|uniref:Tail protein n=1 Tax=Acetobacter oeni TaxID=304077 RepID=A0A511XP08_9PROT|nr:phage tail tube protein [Acetobacter oeni]MBB3884491.1 hypothetical protein [Acetobacter oeni]NHO20423.1 phage tail protein [Acetobacter oeni]GBR00540.1 hypothetical protein AA21952_0137 [Acetobacter oeni LMG 21952]GEN64698.1 hypothetical protein AOE01nite_29220 [Acetobacter oeni]
MSASLYSSTPTALGARAGAASVEIDGVAVDIASELTYDATVVKRELLVGQSGIQGYSETPKGGFISFVARDSGSLSQAALVNIGSCVVVAVLVNGKIITGTPVIVTEIAGVNTAEGTFEVRFEGTVTETTI